MRDNKAFAVAPMMEWTDRNCRFFHRLLSSKAVLYTEMVTADAVRLGDRARLLDFNAEEQPVVLQLGGSDPLALAEAAKIAADWGYSEVNLNVGCPSDRVQSGRFGACLMREPELVGELVATMIKAVDIPVSVKCRIGVDEQDPGPALDALLRSVSDAGCNSVTVHARKAWLQGLSLRENRDIPPLDYDRVYQVKQDFPELFIALNGGLVDIEEAAIHLPKVDGVMLGRAAYQTPWILSDVDRVFYGEAKEPLSRHEIVALMAEYADRQRMDRGTPVKSVARHMMGLFQGLPGARAWRRKLSETIHNEEATGRTLIEAAALVPNPDQKAA